MALERIAALKAWLAEGSSQLALGRELASRVSLDGELENYIEISSSLKRELVYVILHGVHHMALIAVGSQAARSRGA